MLAMVADTILNQQKFSEFSDSVLTVMLNYEFQEILY